jgi:hypothetical protein
MLATRCLPLTCPPVTMETLDTGKLVAPLLYIRLHGLPGQSYLYGDDWINALSAEQVRSIKLPGSLVFLEGCYGLEFAGAFLEAGARAVAGSDEPTYGRRFFLGPSSLIGRRWLEAVQHGAEIGAALARAVGKPKTGLWRIAGNEKARLM